MLFKECTDDFRANFNYNIGNRRFNLLIEPKTKVTTSTTLLFADGAIEGPMVWDEKNNNFKGPELKTVREILVENPSEYLKKNQELANSVKYILVEVPTNEN